MSKLDAPYNGKGGNNTQPKRFPVWLTVAISAIVVLIIMLVLQKPSPVPVPETKIEYVYVTPAPTIAYMPVPTPAPTPAPTPVPTENPEYVKYPGKKLLDEVGDEISYPKDSDFLSEIRIRHSRSSDPKLGAVYALHGLNDGGDWKKLARKVLDGTELQVVAEHSFDSSSGRQTYCCCCFKDSDGTMHSGWINSSFVVS